MQAYQDGKPYIFISYASEDENRVRPVVQYLRQQGFRVWWSKDIRKSSDWTSSITEHLENSTCVIAFISKKSASSKWCDREIAYANMNDKNILPVYFEPVELKEFSPKIRIYMWELQSFYYKDYTKDELLWGDLIEENCLQICREDNVKEKTDEKQEQPIISKEMVSNIKSVDKISQSTQPKSVSKESVFQVGKNITFGSYWQSTSGEKEAISWRVLDKKDDKLLVISEKCLDAKPYNTEWESVTWETCTLRKWLNEEFYQMAFTEQEKGQISLETIQNPYNPRYDTKGGADTTDNLFLLSIEEAKKYFSSDEERQAKATDYAKAQGCRISDETGNPIWWLRSPGNITNCAAFVYSDGGVFDIGIFVNFINVGIRPALWIKS